MTISNTRRSFMQGVGALSLISSLAPPAFAQGGSARVRSEISTPAGQEMLKLYAEAVTKMNDESLMPKHHPKSWRFQANTHDYPFDEPIDEIFTAGPGEDAAVVAAHRKLALGTEGGGGHAADRVWHTCPHGNADQFLPWHRLFVAYFEQSIEKIVGKPFALPYWNYLNPAYRHLPEMFREPTIGGARNWLYFEPRNKRFLEDGLLESRIVNLSAEKQTTLFGIKSLLSTPRRDGFSKTLERGLHGDIHVAIGPPKGMGRTPFAARDPIFWLHHATIDWIWESWRNPGPDGKSPRDPAFGQNWYQPKYHLINADGQLKSEYGAGHVLRVKNLGYQYDTLRSFAESPLLAADSPPSGEPPIVVQQSDPVSKTLSREDDKVTVDLKLEASEGVALGLTSDPATKWTLVLDYEANDDPPGEFTVYTKSNGNNVAIHNFNFFTHREKPLKLDVTDAVKSGVLVPSEASEVTVGIAYVNDPTTLTIKSAKIIADH